MHSNIFKIICVPTRGELLEVQISEFSEPLRKKIPKVFIGNLFLFYSILFLYQGDIEKLLLLIQFHVAVVFNKALPTFHRQF